MLHNSINRYGNLNATRGFFWREIARPTGLLERKKLQQSLVCFTSTLTWITEKELERVINNKGDEFRNMKCSRFSSNETLEEKRENFIAVSKVKMSGSEKK